LQRIPVITFGLLALILAEMAAPRAAVAVDVHRLESGARLHGFVYVSVNGTVNVYDQAGQQQKPLAQLTAGIVSPEGLFVARNGDLLVAGGNGNVPIFHHGSTAPYRILTNVGATVQDATQDAAGNVYATEGRSGQWSDTIAIFAPGSTTPTSTLTDETGAVNVVTDSKDDLFVQTYGSPAYEGGVDEFQAGHKVPQTLPIVTSTPGGIAIDANDNLLVCDGGGEDGFSGGGAVYAPPYTGQPIFRFGLFDGIYGCALDRAGLVWAAGSGNVSSAILINRASRIRDVIPLHNLAVHGIAAD
jgi:hypothetical protein